MGNKGLSMSRVLVTGGAGFIGHHVVRELLSRGAEVIVIDDLSTGSLANIPVADIEFIDTSILNDPALRDAISRSDAIIHLAAVASVSDSIVDPQHTHNVNATGTLRVLDHARQHGVTRVAVASSSAVYGNSRAEIQEESVVLEPISPYGVNKLAGEAYVRAFNSCYGTENVAFRFFNVYGPGQLPTHAYAAVIPKFVHAALHQEELTIHGDGLQSRDFVFVGDVARVLSDTVLNDVSFAEPVVNLASGSSITVLDVAGVIENVLGTTVGRVHAEPRRGDIRSSRASITQLRETFPQFRPVPLEDGIEQTMSWMSTWRDDQRRQ